MMEQPNPDWSDDRVIDYLRHWSIEYGKCGLDGYAANRFSKKYISPAAAILKKRGSRSLAKLLPLLGDEDQNVRLTAAGLAYDVDKNACRNALEELMKASGLVGILAWTMLSDKEGPGTVPFPAVSGKSEP